MINKKILIVISLLLVSFLVVGCFPKQNLPPEITSDPVTTATVGVAYTYGVVATDPNAEDVLAYSLTTEPEGMLINEDSGVISWIPDAVGSFDVTVEVSDGDLSNTQDFAITVVSLAEPELVLVGITVDPQEMTLFEGAKDNITSVTACYEKKGYDVDIALEECLLLTSNSKVATVSNKGEVEAIGVGIADILISFKGKVDTLVVKVSEKEHSIYAFEYEIPEKDILVDVPTDPIAVTFKTTEIKELGYDDVCFKISTIGPDNSTVHFIVGGDEHSFDNDGYWGPDDGFNIPALYSATTNWTLNFNKAGIYTITFSLIEAPDGDVVDEITGSQELTVYDTSP